MKEFVLTNFHRAILHQLPDEGSQFGYHPLVKTVKRVAEELNEGLPSEFPRLTANEVGAEVRSMRLGGYVTSVQSGPRLLGWQRTAAGKAALGDWTPQFKAALAEGTPTFDGGGQS